jgi:NO-binding membrane sensor protein with MHYT domain
MSACVSPVQSERTPIFGPSDKAGPLFQYVMLTQLPFPVRYDRPTVLVSLLVGGLCSAFALVVVSRRRMGFAYLVGGSAVTGCGIAGLHYNAMAAMRLAGEYRFDFLLVTLSVALAV